MININCEKERTHTWASSDDSEYVVKNCKALLCCVENIDNGTIYSICRICGQKWKIDIVDGDIELKKLPKKTRFEFDDKLKVEG